ncbi:hypothetical protein [Brevibacterium album]|uniref:hypothetical protein n=1 Tax=Brevibacterium album TaxID=417948 RepID=UPI000414E59D|nr:hypothetical protein [Brevibacterium album]
MEPGESWAYRARGIDPLVEVRLVREGSQKPARVLVHFVADEFEGREESVPPARLKVRWDDVESFRAREERWDRVSALGPDRDDPRDCAASEILDEFIDRDLAGMNDSDGCSITISRPDELADSLGLRIEQLTEYPEAFREDGKLIAPWPVTELVARAAAQMNAEAVLQRVESEERKAQHAAIHGEYLSGRGRHFIDPEISAKVDRDHGKPIRDVLRAWCGADNVERFDELVELRKEIKRVGEVAERAIAALRAHGHDAVAAQIERELGTPVEMLRAELPD